MLRILLLSLALAFTVALVAVVIINELYPVFLHNAILYAAWVVVAVELVVAFIVNLPDQRSITNKFFS